MGFLDLLNGRAHGRLSSVLSLPVVSPYSPAPDFGTIVIDDIFGDIAKKLPLSRNDAMGIPAVSKARNLLIAAIAKLPLRAIRAGADGTDQDVSTDNAWLYRTNSSVSPYERMAWTVDDLIFYGCSLWLLDRGTPDKDNKRGILDAHWCPTATWSIRRDEDGVMRVFVDELAIAEDRYLLINSPFEGLLNIAQRTLRGARDVEESWVGRARNPIPLIELSVTDGTELEDGEIEELVDAFALARTKPNGAIGYTPQGVEIIAHGTDAPDLSVEGRNAVRTDIGSHLNIRASMLDGTIGIDSLTYTTTAGEKNSFYEFDLPFWTDPIAARLSLDDIVPRGTRVRFDMYNEYNMPAPTGIRVED